MPYFIFLLVSFGIIYLLDRPRCFDDWSEVDYFAKKEGYFSRDGPKVNSEGRQYWLLFGTSDRLATLVIKNNKICVSPNFDPN